MTSKPQKLTGSQPKQLHEALLSAFPNEDTLKQMVFFELGEILDSIAGGQNLSEIVFNLIGWAEAQGRTEELIQGACKQNPGNAELQKFVEERAFDEGLSEGAKDHKEQLPKWPDYRHTANILWLGQWIGITTIGWLITRSQGERVVHIVIGLFTAFYDAVYAFSGDAVYHMLFGVVSGGIVGTAQGLLLHRHINYALRIFGWIAASTIGWAIGWVVGDLVNDATDIYGRWMIIGATIGIFAGLFQWLSLLRHLSVWWILASTIGWMFAFWFVNTVSLLLIGEIISGVIVGTFTGIVLLWMLRQVLSKP
jgi:hypothetical protein